MTVGPDLRLRDYLGYIACLRGEIRTSLPEVHAMRLSYDPTTDSLYIHLAERPAADSDEVTDGVVLDYDASGALVGIDVQHASQRADLERLSVSRLPLRDLDAA